MVLQYQGNKSQRHVILLMFWFGPISLWLLGVAGLMVIDGLLFRVKRNQFFNNSLSFTLNLARYFTTNLQE